MAGMRYAIVDALSPNVNPRPEGAAIDLVILHYTGMEDGPSAIKRLRDPEARVSCHYVVEEDGRVFRLAEERMRAWHAGVSFWAGITDVNSRSIGIEIVNGGHDFGLPDYPPAQIAALIDLLSDILDRRKLHPVRVIGHSDVAPARKDDPGEKFPWTQLHAAGVAIAPKIEEQNRHLLYAPGVEDAGVAGVQQALAGIGYGVTVTGVLDDATQCVVRAFQRRFRQDRIDGALDLQTLALIAEVERITKAAPAV
jgi:N-acetylmuramoyl-L-alanine amidase